MWSVDLILFITGSSNICRVESSVQKKLHNFSPRDEGWNLYLEQLEIGLMEIN